jgi:hypothetical protein
LSCEINEYAIDPWNPARGTATVVIGLLPEDRQYSPQ